jgi:hypothetical protein
MTRGLLSPLLVHVARFVTRFAWQSPARMSEKSDADARFPYEHRQLVVFDFMVFLLWSRRSPVQIRAQTTRFTGCDLAQVQTAQVLPVSKRRTPEEAVDRTI